MTCAVEEEDVDLGEDEEARTNMVSSSSNMTCAVEEEDVDLGEDEEARTNMVSSSSSSNSKTIKQMEMSPAHPGCHILLSSPHSISVLGR